jgi:hypothetical protein
VILSIFATSQTAQGNPSTEQDVLPKKKEKTIVMWLKKRDTRSELKAIGVFSVGRV